MTWWFSTYLYATLSIWQMLERRQLAGRAAIAGPAPNSCAQSRRLPFVRG